MEEDIRMNGDWYIPETNETIAGTLYINKVQKRILLQLTIVPKINSNYIRFRAKDVGSFMPSSL